MAEYLVKTAKITGVNYYENNESSSLHVAGKWSGWSSSTGGQYWIGRTSNRGCRVAYRLELDTDDWDAYGVVVHSTIQCETGSSTLGYGTFTFYFYSGDPSVSVGTSYGYMSAKITNGRTQNVGIAKRIDADKTFSGKKTIYVIVSSGAPSTGYVSASGVDVRITPPPLSLSVSPDVVNAGSAVSMVFKNRASQTLTAVFEARGRELASMSITADSNNIECPASWFSTAGTTDDLAVTVTVTDDYSRTVTGEFTLHLADLGLRVSPTSANIGSSVTLTYSNRYGNTLDVSVSCNGYSLYSFSASRDSSSFTISSSWLYAFGGSYASLDIEVKDSTTGRTADGSVSVNIDALGASANKSAVKTGDPIEITLSNRYGESVLVRFKDGSALIQSYTYNTDTITVTPDVSWFTKTGNANDSMNVSVEIVGEYSDREAFLSFDLTRPVLSVSATSPVTAGNSVTLAFGERNGSTLTVKLKSGNTVLASPDSFSADGLTVATKQKWFQDLSVTTQNYIEVTVEVTDSGGRTASTTFRLEAGDDMAPTISGITFSAEQPTAAMRSAFPGIYVAGYTKLKVSATVSAKYSASAWQVNFTIAGSAPTEMSQSSGSKWEGVSINPVTVNGDVVVSAVDSRGLRSESKLRFSSLTAYNAPSVSAISFHRCREDRTKDDSGGYCLISATFTISPVKDKNSKSAAIASSIYSDSKTLSSYTQTIEWFFAADIEHSYEITLSAIDTITRMDATVKLSTAGVIMDFLAGGKGIGLGKVAEYSNAVEVNPEWTLKVGSIELNGSDLGTLLQQIDQRLRNGGL